MFFNVCECMESVLVSGIWELFMKWITSSGDVREAHCLEETSSCFSFAFSYSIIGALGMTCAQVQPTQTGPYWPF